MFFTKLFYRFKSWLNQNIRRKFLFWSIGFWIISVSILSMTFLWTGQAEIVSDIRDRNVQLASIVSKDINSRVSTILSDIRLYAHRMESLKDNMESQASAMVTLRLSSPQRYLAVYLLNTNNNMLVHLGDPLSDLVGLSNYYELVTRPVIPVDEEVFTASRMAQQTGMYISKVTFIGIDRIPVICVGIPLDYTAGFTRMLVLQVDIRDIWQRINLSTVGKTGFTYAVSSDGTVIAHPDLSHIGHKLPEILDDVLEGYEGFQEYYEKEAGHTVYAAYSPVGSPTNWGIVVEQSKFEADAPVVRTTIIVVIVGLSLATIGTISILIMIQNFTGPILKLTGTAREIRDTGELKKTMMEERPDEIGQLSQSFDQMIDWLQSMEGRLATVAAEERSRLARDLHDAVSQTLFSASIIAEVLPTLWEKDIDKGRERLEEVRQLTRGALAEMRTLLLELRPSALLEAELTNLLSQLSAAISGRTRIPITFNSEGECDTPDDVKVALYRIAQEALNNVAKHSGATNVRVNLLCDPGKVIIEIIDNGSGFDIDKVSSDHLGIGIMQERAADIDAELTVDSIQGRGTEVTVLWKKK